ncbi:hypothetical protein ACT6NV_10410 [Robiginitalea sp. IMCC44478]|uniref:hypothetical protein n=1 Tax=Robiginitalea sp. IMCC44478 TaxID=3459122 RepID=UPI00404298DF
MKNISYFQRIALFMGATCLLLSCNGATKGEETISEPIPAPKQIISLEKAQKLYGNYTTRRVPLIRKYEDSINLRMADPKMQEEAPKKFDVARYGYYDYKTLKQYLAYIEQETKKTGDSISTIRIYFANYPDEPGYVHKRQSSFMLMPTVKKGGREYAYAISEGEKPEAILIGDDLQTADTVQAYFSEAANRKAAEASLVPALSPKPPANPFQLGGSLILNESQMVPPPYN